MRLGRRSGFLAAVTSLLFCVTCTDAPRPPSPQQIRYPVGAGSYQYFDVDGRPVIEDSRDAVPLHMQPFMAVQLGQRTAAPRSMLYQHDRDDASGRFSVARQVERDALRRDSAVAWMAHADAIHVWIRARDAADPTMNQTPRMAAPAAPPIEIVNLNIDTRTNRRVLRSAPNSLKSAAVPGRGRFVLSADSKPRNRLSGGEASDVLRETNRARARGATCGEYGAFEPTKPLAPDARLQRAAQDHANDMRENDFYGHSGADGSAPGARMRRAGFEGSPAGENIAHGQSTAAEVVQGWVKSPGHCRNLMNPSATKLGVGVAASMSRGKLWVQNFGR